MALVWLKLATHGQRIGVNPEFVGTLFQATTTPPVTTVELSYGKTLDVEGEAVDVGVKLFGRSGGQ